MGPGGLDRVFYLPRAVQGLGQISSWRVAIVSHTERKIVELARRHAQEDHSILVLDCLSNSSQSAGIRVSWAGTLFFVDLSFPIKGPSVVHISEL